MKKIYVLFIFIIVLCMNNAFAADSIISKSFRNKIQADYPDIERIFLRNNNSVPSNALASWDVSEAENSRTVMAYVVRNYIDDDPVIDLYIGGNSKIYTPIDASGLFKDFRCKSINNMQYLDTSKTTKTISL